MGKNPPQVYQCMVFLLQNADTFKQHLAANPLVVERKLSPAESWCSHTQHFRFFQMPVVSKNELASTT